MSVLPLPYIVHSYHEDFCFLTLLKEKYFECLKENKNLRDNYEQYKATAEPTIKELKEQNTNLQIMLQAEREVRCNDEYLKKVTELEAYNEKLLNSDIEKHNKIVLLEMENELLKKKIEKMKCCHNCRKFHNLSYDCTCAEVCNEWELTEQV